MNGKRGETGTALIQALAPGRVRTLAARSRPALASATVPDPVIDRSELMHVRGLDLLPGWRGGMASSGTGAPKPADIANFIAETAETLGVDIAQTPLAHLEGLEADILADLERRISEGEAPELSDYGPFVAARLRRVGARPPALVPGGTPGGPAPTPRPPTAGPGGGPPPPPPVRPGSPSEVAAQRARQAREYLDLAKELDGQGLSQAAAAQAWRQRAAMARDLAAKAHNQNVDAYNGAVATEAKAQKAYDAAERAYDQASTPKEVAKAKKAFEKARQELDQARTERRRLDQEFEKSKKTLEDLDEMLRQDQEASQESADNPPVTAGAPPSEQALKATPAMAGVGAPEVIETSLLPDYMLPPVGAGGGPGGGPRIALSDGVLDDDCIKIIRDCAKTLLAGAAPNSAVALLAGMVDALANAAEPCPPCDKHHDGEDKNGEEVANDATDGTDETGAETPKPPEKPQPPVNGGGGGGGGGGQPAPRPTPIPDPTKAPAMPQSRPDPTAPAAPPGERRNGGSGPPADGRGQPADGEKDETRVREGDGTPKRPFRLRDPVGERTGRRDEKLDYQRRLALESFIRERGLAYSIPRGIDLSTEAVFDAERLKLRRLDLQTMARNFGLKLYSVNDNWDLLDDRVFDHHKRLLLDMGRTRAAVESRVRQVREFERMDSADRLEKAFSEALDSDELGEELISQLRGLLTPEALVAMLAFMGLLAGASVLTAGSIIPVITAMVGPTLVPLIIGMYHALTAETIEEFNLGVSEIQRAIVTGGITLVTAGLFRFGGAALGRATGGSAPRPVGGGPRPVPTPATPVRPGMNGSAMGGRMGGRLGSRGPAPRPARPGVTTNGTRPPSIPGQPLPRINGALRVNPPRGGSRLPSPGRSPAAGSSPSTAGAGRSASAGRRVPPSRTRPLADAPEPVTSAPRPAPVAPQPVPVPGSGPGGLATAVRAATRRGTQSRPEPGGAPRPGFARQRPPPSRPRRPSDFTRELAASIVNGLGFGGDYPPFRGWELPHDPDDFTQGIFRDADNPGSGERTLGSVRSDDALTPQRRATVERARQELVEEGVTGRTLESVDRSLRHAEGEAAGVLRNSSITRGLLDINNRYVCAHCILALRRLVPTGKELTVRFSTPGGRNVSLRFRNGERPQIQRNNQWQDMLGTPQEIEVFLLALDSVGGAGH